MHSEDELLPISALQHLAFCERQWGLIHLEKLWEENPLTLEGQFFHKRVDEPSTEVRGPLRIVRSLPIRSLRLGLVGKADVVEFRRVLSTEEDQQDDETDFRKSVSLEGVEGFWTVAPVEYKRGRPKFTNCDKVQVCAQALCLEEMLNLHIPSGKIFYGKTQKRLEVPFDSPLRKETEQCIMRLHELTRREITPQAKYEKKCDQCSLIDQCLPKTIDEPGKARAYFKKNLAGSMENTLE